MDAPWFVKVSDIGHAIDAWAGGPAIIKPALSSGSRGVAILEVVGAASRPYLEKAQAYSKDGCACLEEYIDGDDVSVEGFIFDRKVSHAFISKKHTRGFAVIGHEFPNELHAELNDAIISQVQALIDSGVLTDGPFDADFRVRGGRAVLLEISPRLGGNGLPVLVEAAYGVSLIEMSLRHAMQDLNDLNDVRCADRVMPHASLLLYSDEAGIVESVATPLMVKLRLPDLKALCINLDTGQEVEKFQHGGHVFGYCIIRRTDSVDFNSMVKQLKKALSIQIDQRTPH
jgi:biotin carboxylase